MKPIVSVVVPTYHRAELLDRCLAALAAQDFDPRDFEIIVADDAACPETARQVGAWNRQAAPAIQYVAVSGAHGPAAARNRGWHAARGDIIAFTDDDCLPTPGWLAAGMAAFTGCCCASDHQPVDAVWGRTVVPLPPAPTDYERDAAGLEQGEFITANCFYCRATLACVGGFDERFRIAWREDSDLFFSVLEQGGRAVHAADAVVVHPVRPAIWGISVRQQRKSFYNALLYKKHPALYRERVQPAPPWRYYASVAALAATLGGALARRPTLALAGGATWAALTGRFCAQRLCGASHAPRHIAEMAVTSALIPPLAVFWRLRGAARFRVPFL